MLDTRVTLIAAIKKVICSSFLERSHASFHLMRRIEDCDSQLVLHRDPHRKRASFGEEVLATENVNDARWAFAPSRLFFLSRAISTPSAAADPQKQSFY